MRASGKTPGPLGLLGVATLTTAAAGTAWVVAARRERRRARLLHRTLVELLLNTLTAGDPITARHSRRVADLTSTLAEALAMNPRQRGTLRVAALLHDMGKIDDELFHIIHRRDALDEEQKTRIKRHPVESAHILEPLEPMHPGIMQIVASHHECWNGKGYPQGLSGEEIPLAARLISVADVFDALTQPREYREALSVEEALERIHADSGTKFDPQVVALLDRPEIAGRWREIARSGREVEERVH